MPGTNQPRRYRAFVRRDLDRLPELSGLDPDLLLDMKAVSAVFPFRTNPYVVDTLIDWKRVPDDPIFQLTFPQPGMLDDEDRGELRALISGGASEHEVGCVARRIQRAHNPHPAKQMELNVPEFEGRRLPGMQHKYRETVLFFPSQGQTCHAYCSYCFRWPQFVGIDELKFASREVQGLEGYLRQHTEVSSVLFTGGDPLVMTTAKLRRYVEPLLDPSLEHLISIRIGTKAPAYWPFRFLTDPDADDLLALFREVRAAGRHLALMAHFTHPRELETKEAQAALRRIAETGAVVRCQSPVVRHVNDSADALADLWRLEVKHGAVPYYMFVERDTGPKQYFELPLARVHEIWRGAYRQVSGLARTVRGPSMSANPGKVRIVGDTEVRGERVFVLEFLQGRDPEWVGRPFFACFDPHATWLDQLRPAFGEREFFFEAGLREIEARSGAPANHHSVEWE